MKLTQKGECKLIYDVQEQPVEWDASIETARIAKNLWIPSSFEVLRSGWVVQNFRRKPAFSDIRRHCQDQQTKLDDEG